MDKRVSFCKICVWSTDEPGIKTAYKTIDEHMQYEHFHSAPEPGDKYLREAAKSEGLSYTEYCRKYGLLSPTQERQIRRREVPLNNE